VRTIRLCAGRHFSSQVSGLSHLRSSFLQSVDEREKELDSIKPEQITAKKMESLLNTFRGGYFWQNLLESLRSVARTGEKYWKYFRLKELCTNNKIIQKYAYMRGSIHIG